MVPVKRSRRAKESELRENLNERREELDVFFYLPNNYEPQNGNCLLFPKEKCV